jgi:hypothetical protein
MVSSFFITNIYLGTNPSYGNPSYYNLPPVNQPYYPRVNQPNYPPVNQPNYPPVNQPFIPPVNQPNYPPVNQPNYPPVNQPNYPPVNQPNYPPVNQPYYPEGQPIGKLTTFMILIARLFMCLFSIFPGQYQPGYQREFKF